MVPLSEEVRIVPESPHVTNHSGVLSEVVLSEVVFSEVVLSEVVLSEVVVEVELCSSSLAQEIIFSAKRDTRLM